MFKRKDRILKGPEEVMGKERNIQSTEEPPNPKQFEIVASGNMEGMRWGI